MWVPAPAEGTATTVALLTVHQEPVAGKNPDEDEHDRQREGQQLRSSEAPTATEGNPGKHTCIG